jgi:hypothetical protein
MIFTSDKVEELPEFPPKVRRKMIFNRDRELPEFPPKVRRKAIFKSDNDCC